MSPASTIKDFYAWREHPRNSSIPGLPLELVHGQLAIMKPNQHLPHTQPSMVQNESVAYYGGRRLVKPVKQRRRAFFRFAMSASGEILGLSLLYGGYY